MEYKAILFYATAVCILMQNPACGFTFDTPYEIVTPESECGELFADEMFLTFNDTDRVLSAVPYLRACSNIEAVVDCIGQRRNITTNGSLVGENYTMHETEKSFPIEADIKWAYYLSCPRSFYIVEDAFLDGFREKECDHVGILRNCSDLVDPWQLEKFRHAHITGDKVVAGFFACRAMLHYYLCKAEYYYECYPPWEVLLEMILPSLGLPCLMRHYMWSPITRCDDDPVDYVP